MALHRLYGLTIDSEFALPAPRAETGPADLTVRWGVPRPVPPDPPAGRLVAWVDLGGKTYSTARTGDGYVVRFPSVCDALVTEDLDRVTLIPQSYERRPLAEVLFAGSVMSKVLMLAGECVLHASAATIGGEAIAYVGQPGGGKSTLAALTCAAGGRLIADDVLRLMPRGDGWHCATGTVQLRLRRQAETLAPLLEGTTEETVDSRVGVTMGVRASEPPLGAIVFPRPSRTASAVAVERLTEHEVLMQLTRYPRVVGWKDPEVLARSFRWNARVAREVPAFAAVVPWGPPFDPGVVRAILERVGERDAVR